MSVYRLDDASFDFPSAEVADDEYDGFLAVGSCFFGESMFARVSDASKCAFAHFAGIMFENGLPWIDCQVHTDHLARFGAKEIPRAEYLLMLRDALKTY